MQHTLLKADLQNMLDVETHQYAVKNSKRPCAFHASPTTDAAAYLEMVAQPLPDGGGLQLRQLRTRVQRPRG